jgi:hypothetical protein
MRRPSLRVICVSLLVLTGATQADGVAYVQVIRASPDPDLGKLAKVYVTDSYPGPLPGRPIAQVRYAQSTGYVPVPAGSHSLVVCGETCSAGSYDLGAGESSTFVVIGGREEIGRDKLEGTWDVQLVETTTKQERRWRTVTKRRASFLNGVVKSPALELCVRSGDRRWSPFVAGGPEDPRGEIGTYGTNRSTTFGEWGGVGRVDDDNAAGINGRYRDLPTGAVELELRRYSDEPCAGASWATARLPSAARGMSVLVAVGHAEDPSSKLELIACSEPEPRSASRCSRSVLRRPSP